MVVQINVMYVYTISVLMLTGLQSVSCKEFI